MVTCYDCKGTVAALGFAMECFVTEKDMKGRWLEHAVIKVPFLLAICGGKRLRVIPSLCRRLVTLLL